MLCLLSVGVNFLQKKGTGLQWSSAFCCRKAPTPKQEASTAKHSWLPGTTCDYLAAWNNVALNQVVYNTLLYPRTSWLSDTWVPGYYTKYDFYYLSSISPFCLNSSLCLLFGLQASLPLPGFYLKRLLSQEFACSESKLRPGK